MFGFFLVVVVNIWIWLNQLAFDQPYAALCVGECASSSSSSSSGSGGGGGGGGCGLFPGCNYGGKLAYLKNGPTRWMAPAPRP